MEFTDTRTLLKALADAAAGLQWTPDETPVNVFEVVAFYDAPRLAEALTDLLEFKKTVCLIIPVADRHENTRTGNILRVKRDMEIDIIISDRDRYAKGKPAYFGMKEVGGSWDLITDRLGVIGMKDLLVDFLTGNKLGLTGGVLLEPLSGVPLRVAASEDDAGRDAWIQTFTTSAGEKRLSI